MVTAWIAAGRKTPEQFISNARPHYESTVDSRGLSMVDYVLTYLAVVAEEVAKFDDPASVSMKPELRVTLDADMGLFGTADFVATGNMGGVPTGLVVDLKYGMGVVIETKDNPQLAYYAAALRRTSKKKLLQVRVVIVQPRIEEFFTPILYSTSDLDQWQGVLLRGVEKALWQMATKNYELHAGEHCRWCSAKGICGTHEKYLREQAALEFPSSSADGDSCTLPDPNTLSPDRMARIMNVEDQMVSFMQAVRGSALHLLSGGVDIPGYKLVTKRTYRQWKDEDAAVKVLREKGIDPYAPPKIKSVALVEKEKALGYVEDLVFKPEGEMTIAKEKDKRTALSVGSEFLDEASAPILLTTESDS